MILEIDTSWKIIKRSTQEVKWKIKIRNSVIVTWKILTDVIFDPVYTFVKSL